MKKKSKKIFTLIVTICILGIVGIVIGTASLAASVTCTVTPGNYSVEITAGSPVTYSDMLMNSTKDSETVTANNNGTLTAKFLISGVDATYSTYTWPLSTTISAADDYLHAYSTDLTEETGTAITEDYTTGWEDLLTSDSDLAASIAKDTTQTFQLDMRTPASGGAETSLGNQYSADVTVTATAP